MEYIIDKLNKVQWTSFTGYKMTAEGTAEGHDIRLEIKSEFSNLKYSADKVVPVSPIKVSAVIYIDDVYASQEDIRVLEDIEILRDWYMTKKNSIEDTQREAKDSAQDQAREIFESL